MILNSSRNRQETDRDTPGIVIRDRDAAVIESPRIVAFIWGGKVRPTPTLPFGRWKGAA